MTLTFYVVDFFAIELALMSLVTFAITTHPALDHSSIRARWREMHHLYLGALLFAAGIVTENVWVRLAGAAVMADDAWQHYIVTITHEWMYRSPLHQLYAVFYRRLPFLRRLNRWLDGVLA